MNYYKFKICTYVNIIVASRVTTYKYLIVISVQSKRVSKRFVSHRQAILVSDRARWKKGASDIGSLSL